MDLHAQNQKNQNPEMKTIDLTELAQILWIHKGLIALVMLVFLICSSLFVTLKLPIYQTSALIQVSSQNNGGSAFSSMAALGGGASFGGGNASQADIEMTLINSDYILQPVMHELGLDILVQPKFLPIIGAYLANQYQGFGPAPVKFGLSHYAWGGEKIKVAFFSPPFDDRMQEYTLIAKNSGHYVLFSPDGRFILNGKVGQIELNSTENVSILVTDLSARSGTPFYVEKRSETDVLLNMRNALKTMELSPPSSTGGQLGAGETGLIQLSVNSTNPTAAKTMINAIIQLTANQNSKQQASKNQKLLDFIQKQLPIAQRNLSASESALNLYQAKSGVLNLSEQSRMLLTQITQIDNQITLNEMNQATLLQTYTEKDPIIQNINLKQHLLTLQKLKIQNELADLPMKDQQAIDLMRNVKVQNSIYILLLNKYQQTLLTKTEITSQVTILNDAQIPDEPMPAHSLLILLASLLLGLIIGSLIVLSFHLLGGRISDPYWSEKELGIHTLAIIPFSKEQAKGKKNFDAKKIKAIPILAKSNADDLSIESIRSLRTNLLFTMKKNKTNVVSIGGIVPKTGKSFISINLAVVLSESAKRVLLIDADMRRGYLNQYFKLSHSPGLSEALENIYPLEKIIRRTSIENLDFMSTGIFPHNPSELLLSDRFAEIIQHVATQYDVVIIDAPPILAVNDASVIAQQAGINYIVIPGNQLKADEIKVAVRRFYNDGVKINGSLFNFAKKNLEQTSSYGQSYGRYAKYTKREQ